MKTNCIDSHGRSISMGFITPRRRASEVQIPPEARECPHFVNSRWNLLRNPSQGVLTDILRLLRLFRSSWLVTFLAPFQRRSFEDTRLLLFCSLFCRLFVGLWSLCDLNEQLFFRQPLTHSYNYKNTFFHYTLYNRLRP